MKAVYHGKLYKFSNFEELWQFYAAKLQESIA